MSYVSKSSYNQESQESGKLMWDSPRRYPSHPQIPISLGWVTLVIQMCNRLCWLIFSQDWEWAANLQTQPHRLICHEHGIWSLGARNYIQFKGIKCWHWIYLSLPTSLEFRHNWELVTYSSSLEAGGCNILQRCLWLPAWLRGMCNF